MHHRISGDSCLQFILHIPKVSNESLDEWEKAVDLFQKCFHSLQNEIASVYIIGIG